VNFLSVARVCLSLIYGFGGLGLLIFRHDDYGRLSGVVYSCTAIILVFIPDKNKTP